MSCGASYSIILGVDLKKRSKCVEVGAIRWMSFLLVRNLFPHQWVTIHNFLVIESNIKLLTLVKKRSIISFDMTIA